MVYHQGSRHITEEGVESIEELEGGKSAVKCPSRHEVVGTHINSKQVWLPEQDLFKIKPIKNSRV